MAFQLIEKQVIYDGKKVRLEVHHLDDDEGKRHRQEICVHSGAVVILPFLDDQTILLIRNMRYTVGQYLLELPAGTIDKKEPAIDCAGRELQEETGYLAGRLKLFGSFFASPGILTEKIHGEDIEVIPTGFADALEMIRTAQIEDAKTIAALLMYDKFGRGK
jgi:ADP-ribose pyrophosphatase